MQELDNNVGIVVRTTGESYVVRTLNGVLQKCFIKGNFRIKGIKSTNPLAIGDKVHFLISDNSEYALIDKIFDRRNYIIRRSTNLSKQTHIIAANLDKVFLVISACLPKTDTMFIDRFLVSANAYNVPAEIVLNKADLYDEEASLYAGFLMELYESIGYKCWLISATEKKGINRLKESMKGNISMFAGNSGVGKSTIINALYPQAQLKTGEISSLHHSGKHTTTFAQMISFEGIDIIDTPGIKSFGMVKINKEELALYFPEMKERLKDCKYYNCTHTHEPDCAIKKAVEEEEISIERYNNYLKLLAADDMN